MSAVKEALKMAGVAIDALEVIQGLTKIGGDKAAVALAAIDKIIGSVRGGLEGRTSPDIVEHEIKSLASALADHDAAADEIVRRRIEAAKANEP